MEYRKVQVTIPYDGSLGKNKALIYGHRRVGKQSDTSANQDGIFYRIRGEINRQNIKFEQGKIRVWLHVIREKDPANQERLDTDPVNFQQYIIDAVQLATHVDDTWYESRVTWEVDPSRTGIQITVEQGDEPDGR